MENVSSPSSDFITLVKALQLRHEGLMEGIQSEGFQDPYHSLILDIFRTIHLRNNQK